MHDLWCLYTTNRNDEWELVDAFSTLAQAVAHMREMEKTPTASLFLQTHVEPHSTDDEILSLFQFTGYRPYAIRLEPAQETRAWRDAVNSN